MAPNQAALALEDIIPPASVNFWPPAIGWWLLLTLAIFCLVFSVIFVRRYQKKWGYRKCSLRLLDNIYNEWRQQALDDTQVGNALLTILKRTALTAYPQHHNIAAMQGKMWVDFLNCQVSKNLFDSNLKQFICEQQYQLSANVDIDYLYHQCAQWIKQHGTRVTEMTTDV
jgi:hypothetical protein